MTSTDQRHLDLSDHTDPPGDLRAGLPSPAWKIFLPLLRCPTCHADLDCFGTEIRCPRGHRFREQDGVPILLAEDREVRTMPADHVSNPIDPEVLTWLDQLDGFSLNLGAGATIRRPQRCVEIEYAVFRNTTAVADAHNLPFKDNVFDAIVSYNTFEHLADPPVAARELYRILKPGGELRVQSAFLQPLHEEPAHFYNATEYGLRRWFADFEITDCFVPPNMNPAYGLGWMASSLLAAVAQELGAGTRGIVANSRLSCWGDEDNTTDCSTWPPAMALRQLSSDAQRHFSFGFELRATRPDDTGSPPRGVPTRASGAMPVASRPEPPDSTSPIGALLPLLRCPTCHADLDCFGTEIRCPRGHRFREQDGVPILLAEDREVRTMPADHVSNPIDPEVLTWLDQLDGFSLNLGAGATIRRPQRCVEIEYAVFRNTTAVADAHNLPFKDNVFDAIVSYNTFEHLADPPVAARELYRILKPGGELRVQSAFLQPLHEEPAHFYNATEYGLRRWFADFEITDCFVPPNMNPLYAIGWLTVHMLWHNAKWQGQEVRDMLGATRLSQWARFWEEPTTRVGFLPIVFDRLPDEARRHFAAGLELRGRKQTYPGSPSLSST